MTVMTVSRPPTPTATRGPTAAAAKPCRMPAACGPPIKTMVRDPWIRPRSSSLVAACVMALRKVLSRKLTAPPATRARSAAHRRGVRASSTTVTPQAIAAPDMSAPCRRARVKDPDTRPMTNTPAG